MGISLLQAISNNSLKAIHEESLSILEKIGMRIEDPRMQEFLIGKGCTRDNNGIIHFPAQVVETAIGKKAISHIMGSRGGKREMALDSVHFRCQSGCIYMIDSQTGECRGGTLQDVKELTKIIEKSEHLSVVTSLLYPWDVPIEERDVVTVETMLAYSTKHIYVQPYTGASAGRIAHLVEEAGSTRKGPYVTFIVSSTSPLVLSQNEIECLRVASQSGIPVMLGGTPICGATSPVTISSQVILAHAEALALYTILQLLQPGSPATYGIRPAALDMRTGNTTWGDVEWGIASFILAHLAHSLGFLTDAVGFPTDSKLSDFQAGAEKGFAGGILSLAPCNMIAGCGFIETILTASAAQIVLDNELAGMFARVARGVEWDDAHRAFNLIQRIGPGGNFLAEDHTVQFYREELYQPTIFDRTMRHSWVQNGSADVVSRAGERAKSLAKE